MTRHSKKEVLDYAKERQNICQQLKEMVVEQLCLDIEPTFITDDQPLFGRGLELDSVDALELATGIYDKFMITLSDGDTTVFSSINTMADCVMTYFDDEQEDVTNMFIES